MAKKILMAEDSESVRVLMSEALQKAGYEVVEAHDGEDALQKIRSSPIDMLITDLHMPRLDGIDLIRSVRRMEGNRFLPIIMLTSDSAEESRRKGRAAGASSWIVKPFRPQQLLAVVQTVMA